MGTPPSRGNSNASQASAGEAFSFAATNIANALCERAAKQQSLRCTFLAIC